MRFAFCLIAFWEVYPADHDSNPGDLLNSERFRQQQVWKNGSKYRYKIGINICFAYPDLLDGPRKENEGNWGCQDGKEEKWRNNITGQMCGSQSVSLKYEEYGKE